MKPSLIFHQYVWLTETLRLRGRMTLAELDDRWQRDEVADGNPLSRTTFNRHRDALLDMFGIIVDCDLSTHEYYIANPEVLADDTVERWMLRSLTVGGVLGEALAVQDRLLLENVPAGEEYLAPILRAMKSGRQLRVVHRRFGADEGRELTLSPYALKLSHQRWYLLAHNGHWVNTYALDRIVEAELQDQTFAMPDDFSPADYFANYYGVLTCTDDALQHIVIRAYGLTPDYLRTLPLHPSQRELEAADGHTDFGLDLCPTPDFVGALCNPGIEVLQPEALRQRVKAQIEEMRRRYE